MAFLAFIGGMILALGLGVGLFIVILIFAFNVTSNGDWWMSAAGLIQWIYLIPLAWLFIKKGSKSFAAGLIFGGGLMFLLISACWGLFMIH